MNRVEVLRIIQINKFQGKLTSDHKNGMCESVYNHKLLLIHNHCLQMTVYPLGFPFIINKNYIISILYNI